MNIINKIYRIKEHLCGLCKKKSTTPKIVTKIIYKEALPNQWIILKEAFKMLGIYEVEGGKSNQELLDIINYWMPDVKDDSDAAWCVVAINEILKRAGFKPFPTLVARELLDQPNIKVVDYGEPGFIAVYWRDNPRSWKGHAHFYLHEKNGYIYGIGGNQRNGFNVAAYRKERLLGYIDTSHFIRSVYRVQ